jgi:hypothetical protein
LHCLPSVPMRPAGAGHHEGEWEPQSLVPAPPLFPVRVGIKGFIFCQPRQCFSRQIPKSTQIAIYDCLALRMRLEPAFTVPKELFDFVFSHPVVFVCIEHWDQNVKMGEQVLQGNALADLHGVVRSLTPLGKLLIKRVVLCDDLIPQWLE